MSLAIFDLDNTLLGGDSDHAWGEFIVAHRIVDPDEYKARTPRYHIAPIPFPLQNVNAATHTARA